MGCESDFANSSNQCDGNVPEKNGGMLEDTSCENKNINRLSKKALKRLIGREKWLERRKVKRLQEKQRKKEKRAALKKVGLGQSLRRFRGKSMEQSSCKIRVAIDMSFDTLMFYITSFDGSCREIYDSIESNQNQDIFLKAEPLQDLFKPYEIVYLTAESENVLTHLEDSKVYVIGGLVDHNSEKGLCYELARRKGYAHARLPIDEFVEMKTRKVLTINHVFEILAHFSENGDWEKAFFAVIPSRKGMSKKIGIGNASETSGK
ncbi:hypothetical protein KIN20_028398 [Parelaphostrongylus tenuis]|uniref:tRNA (guanine(9)-N(1))-methyltransferase n=1 Tax=Parelaphostrongylus tenuis TaxID=148309 RepID=A0AAD5R120_PARTN|nr:hypothetical protein KIN20_028398 [Parelaphostrongylus tenuis]